MENICMKGIKTFTKLRLLVMKHNSAGLV